MKRTTIMYIDIEKTNYVKKNKLTNILKNKLKTPNYF